MGVRLARGALAVVCSVALVTGCTGGTQAEEPIFPPDQVVTFAEGEYLPVLRTEHYSSLRALADDATIVAVARVAADHEVRADATGFRDVPMVLEEVLRGEHTDGETVVVRTDVAAPGADGRALLETGLELLVFLTPFERTTGVEEGVWVTVGHLAGVLQRMPDSTFRVIDPDSSLLKGAFTRDEVVAEIDGP